VTLLDLDKLPLGLRE